MLELKQIEAYHKSHPELTINQAAYQWIDGNAVAWRAKHPLTI
jgi:hypothetical protein